MGNLSKEDRVKLNRLLAILDAAYMDILSLQRQGLNLPEEHKDLLQQVITANRQCYSHIMTLLIKN